MNDIEHARSNRRRAARRDAITTWTIAAALIAVMFAISFGTVAATDRLPWPVVSLLVIPAVGVILALQSTLAKVVRSQRCERSRR